MDNIVSGKFIVISVEIYFVKSNSKEKEKAQFPFKRRFWKIQVLTNVDLECHWCFPVALQKKKITISYFKIKVSKAYAPYNVTGSAYYSNDICHRKTIS